MSPPSSEPTPRTPTGMQPHSAPAPRPAAVQPPPREAESLVQTDTAGTKLLGHPRAQGSSLPRAGRGEPWGEGSTNPCTASRA